MPESPKIIRAFIAVEIDTAVRESTAQLMENLRKGFRHTGAHPKWVAPEHLHVTLFFLGKTAPETIGKIKTELGGVAERRAAFTTQFQGLGVFPNPKRPTVIWLGLDHGKRLMKDLQLEVVRVLRPLGYEPDRRTFHPHLTLARIKASRGVAGMMEVIHGHQPADCGVSPIARLVLYQSDLKPAGPIYTPLQTWSLQQP